MPFVLMFKHLLNLFSFASPSKRIFSPVQFFRMRIFSAFALLFLMLSSGHAQLARTYTSSEILAQMKKLKVLGSVLYIAAHPDDENTRLIAWLANQKHYRTGYLSLTRGDGGQNLIGDEQGVELGLIRTQELLAARRIDGGEQFFTSAYDFGFSKSPEETFAKWNHERILADAVWIVRKFQPDVIVARFPEDSRAGHGHHSASGIIAREVFDAAADPNKFPEQLKNGVKPWQAKRMLWNTFNFGGGGNNTIDSSQFSLDVGDYSPLLGKSIGELAGESRSQHKSQGFGVSRQRGTAREFFTPIKGDRPNSELLDGVNTGWSRIADAAGIDAMVQQLTDAFRHENPAASIGQLRNIINKVQGLEASVWKDAKLKSLQELVLLCAGIYTEATVARPEIIAGDTVNISINLINRSGVPVELKYVKAGNTTLPGNRKLELNRMFSQVLKTKFDAGLMQTQPYWLRESQQNGRYKIDDQQLIGLPENQPLEATIALAVADVEINIRQPIQFRSIDPVKAELYQPTYITNPFLVYNAPSIVLFRKGMADSARLQVNISGLKKADVTAGKLMIENQDGSYKSTIDMGRLAWNGGDEYSFAYRLPNYLRKNGIERDVLNISFQPGGEFGNDIFQNARRSIAYDHIPTQTWHYRDQLLVMHVDLKTDGKNIGYLPGAGDKMPAALSLMGFQVTELKPADLKAANLEQYDAIITGVRAYNVHDYLFIAYPELTQYVAQGGNLIVQYNTSNFISQLKGKIAPYPFNIGRTRITEENSTVKFLQPQHPVFNFPNKIGPADFEGWVQERSIYHAEGLDSLKWQMPLGFADSGEPMQNGSLAIAPYGKGNFVYTGLVFFRQLPAGVPGAYRLLANLIALPRAKS
jgi:LmbE family N-acetylglucosaminyl deacetylase